MLPGQLPEGVLEWRKLPSSPQLNLVVGLIHLIRALIDYKA